ncbi:hypothetical protein B0J13DRAFT_580323 [Dactylonectria estremocensis]|uniref:Major facilitator superfamily (MFS) profile domain-containing protein n=1 Tax=Dactylonectria estremocensis TaxID=1079267 RepID=A0A9P9JET7_9HYPO|nr:hypothetical protein B0J13DRAFT_580323 [Dactylonectria estremocensis]
MTKLPKITDTYFVAMVATVGGMLFGFDISSMAAIVTTEQYIDYFDNPCGVKQGAIGSALAAGSIVGSLIAGPISDKWGRPFLLTKTSQYHVCLFLWLIGTAVQVATKRFGPLVSGRVVNGVSVGIASSQVLVYLAEIAKRERRGRIIIVQQLAIEWGILIMYFIGYGCGYIKGTASFRTAWEPKFIPCIFLMIGLPFLPQSGSGWRKFIKNGMWKRTMAGFSVQAWQQMSGVNFMVSLSSTLYSRHPSMKLCHFVVGGMLESCGVDVPGGVEGNANVVIRVTGSPAYTVIAFSYLLIIIYALTLAPVAWIYAAEVWSTVTRATGMGLARRGQLAVQLRSNYPETCGKSIEEVELLFVKGAMPAWKTKKGGSRLEAEVAAVQEAKDKGKIDLLERELPGHTEKS